MARREGLAVRLVQLAGALAWLMLTAGSAAASGPFWPEDLEVGVPLTVGTDPLAQAVGALADNAADTMQRTGPSAFDAGEQWWCDARERSNLGACGSPVALDTRAVATQVDAVHALLLTGLPFAGLDIEITPAPAPDVPGVSIPVLRTPDVVIDAAPFVSVLQPLADAAPVDDAPAWQLLRQSWDAAAAVPQPAVPIATVAVSPVHIANPIAAPEGPLVTFDSPSFAAPSLLHASPQVTPAAVGPSTVLGLAAAAEGASASPVPTFPLSGPFLGAETWAPVDAAPPAPAAANAPATSSAAASAPAGWEPGEAAARLVVGPSLLLPVWAMYRRIRATRALDQPQRKDIYDRVVAEPGMTPGDLRAATGLHYTTCVHHLRILERLGMIELKRLGGQLRVFENHSRYSPTEARALAAARSPTARALLWLALARPGVTQADAAKHLGVARSTVKHHVDRLVEWGVLQVEADAANVRLRVAPGATAALQALMTVPGAPPLLHAPASS